MNGGIRVVTQELDAPCACGGLYPACGCGFAEMRALTLRGVQLYFCPVDVAGFATRFEVVEPKERE